VSIRNIEQLPIEEVNSGAMLGRDVVDQNERLLVSADSILTTEILAMLTRRGITSLPIVEELAEEKAAEKRKAIVGALNLRFRQMEGDQDMTRLKDIVKEYRLRGLSSDA